MSKTWKDGDRRNRDKRLHRIERHRVIRDGLVFPDSDMQFVDDVQEINVEPSERDAYQELAGAI